jgi:CheY-like chemotaxis protein
VPWFVIVLTMEAGSKGRKVLLIKSEPLARDLLDVLVYKLGCRHEAVADARKSLATVRHEDFDAVLLDLRSSVTPPAEVVVGIHHLRFSLLGRVLVITGEVDDRATLDLVERYVRLLMRRSRLIFGLAGRLRALLRIAPLPGEIQR